VSLVTSWEGMKVWGWTGSPRASWRAAFAEEALTGERLRNRVLRGGGGVSAGYLDAVEKTAGHDPIPENHWA